MQRNKLNNIPETLRISRSWVCWRARPSKNGKIDKIPINPTNGKNAQSNNQKTWGNFNTALAGLGRFNLSGIGFMFGQNEFFGVDIDHCRNKETGTISDFATEIIQTLDSYTEISPSGTGIHIICKGKIPEGERKNDKLGLEMYESGRFFTITGENLDDGHIDVEERTSEIEKMHSKYLKKSEKKQDKPVTHDINLSDNDLVKKAISSKNGSRFEQLYRGNWQGYYSSQSQADQAFCNMLAFWCGKDLQSMDSIFRQSGLMRPKWDERHGHATYGQITINEAIDKCVEVYTSKGENVQKNAGNVHENTEKVTKDKESVQKKHIKRYMLDDSGNAERLIDLHGKDLHFSFTNNVWYIWNGKCWEVDETGEIQRRADDTIAQMSNDLKELRLKNEEDDYVTKLGKWISKSRSYNTLTNMIKVSRHKPGIAILPAQMDSDRSKFNCLNGTIDLRNGQIHKHNREDIITKLAPVEYKKGAKCDLWLSFLDRIMDGNKELIEFMQKAIGYSLTGSITEQCIFIAFGNGSNGKSTFLETISAMIGDYAMNTQAETIMAKDKSNSSTQDLARLKGARFVTTVEPEEGKRLSEGLVKQISGGDPITCRFLYGKEFEYVPDFKLWMATNHKPVIKGTDNGIWRRIRLIPFTVTIPDNEKDTDLPKKLKAELSGILNWAIEGCLKWQKDGLGMPLAVQAATEGYRSDMDILKNFLHECCIGKKDMVLASTTLYKVYQIWCERNGEHPISQVKLGIKLKDRGMVSKAIHGGYKGWKGIVLSDIGNEMLNGPGKNTVPKYEQQEMSLFEKG